jgi:GcrA cell cycle regulator
MRTATNQWADEIVERLKVLWNEGMSCSRIARVLNGAFGVALTRNSVIGKVDRLGLGSRKSGGISGMHNGGGMAKAPRVPKAPRPVPLTSTQIEEKLSGELPPTDDPFSSKGCRWPIGEIGAPDFRFCQRPRGKRANGCESSWCEGHHALGTRRPDSWEKAAGRAPSGRFADNAPAETVTAAAQLMAGR